MIDKESLDLIEERRAELKRIFPEIFVDEEIAINKLCEALGKHVNTNGERYSFNWAGRTNCLKVRDRRSKATLTPCREESVDFDKTKNVFLEGENLEILKLLQKSYQGKIKMIYIDPPYNTGKDFVYKDDYSDSLKKYLRYTGQINGNGEKTLTNSETNGRYHSKWLSMMYPRLFLARNLLSEDGIIFISIDDNEVHNLRMMMNEIFGEENFVESFIWRSRLGKGSTSTETATIHEYVICYAKEIEKVGLVPDIRIKEKQTKERLRQWGQGDRREDRKTMYYSVHSEEFGDIFPKKPDETDGRWRVNEMSFKKLIEQGLVTFEKQDDGRVEAYRIIPAGSETETAQSSILDGEIVKTTAHGSKELKDLFDGKSFDYPKPTTLIKFLISLINDNNIFVLDFFAGSGTTAHAVLAQNVDDGGKRKFILVQLPEPTPEDSEPHKSGYITIADICKERIRRAIKKVKEEDIQSKIDFGFKVFKLSKSNCFVWDEDAISNKETLAMHIGECAKGASLASNDALLFELMLREGFKLDSGIEQIIEGKNKFYKVTDDEHSLWMCFDESINENVVKNLLLSKDDKLIVLDSALTDTQKVNLIRKLRIETV